MTERREPAAATDRTACPLCKYNLVKSGSQVPVGAYFTELLAEALGVKEEEEHAEYDGTSKGGRSCG